MNTFINNTLADILTAVLTCAAAWVIYYINVGAQIAKEKVKAIKDERQKALVEGAVDRVNDLAQKAVAKTEQTTAAELRNAVKDGNINKSELLALGKKVADDVYGQLSKDAIDALQAEIGDVKKYIEDTVETEVLKLKTNTSPVPVTITTSSSNVFDLVKDSKQDEPVKTFENENKLNQTQPAVQNTLGVLTNKTEAGNCAAVSAVSQNINANNVVLPGTVQTENTQLSIQKALNQIHEIVKNVDLNN